MRKILLAVLTFMAIPMIGWSATTETQQKAIDNVQRAIDIMEAVWSTSIKGNASNLYLVDVYNTQTGEVSGPADVWPYTAVIEAHCSILEALNAVKDIAPELYASKFEQYKTQLTQLIENLEYYRGTLTIPSYAGSYKWSPFAVPRANQPGTADVSGIKNVYDDQMWLSRELIRAYRLTDNINYLEEAAYLADYVIDGWDCWRDENGEEYGGITWGPGYNSKHACSNAPIIQPLIWLSDLYKDSDETVTYRYRTEDNSQVKQEVRTRYEQYLDFAKKVYDWQKTNLKHSSGVYWDMMGADNEIKVNRGYRQHVDCGDPTGAFISYNTGTMIAGAVELYRVTNEQVYLDDMTEASKAAFQKFAKYDRKQGTYVFSTDETAESGFGTWFNDVLMRSYIDAYPYDDSSYPRNALNSFQTNLDYAFENHNRNNLLPIHLIDGWGDEKITKGFHQSAFASEYAMLAVWLMTKDNGDAAITDVIADPLSDSQAVYSISGVKVGEYKEVHDSLPKGVYIVGERKVILGQ